MSLSDYFNTPYTRNIGPERENFHMGTLEHGKLADAFKDVVNPLRYARGDEASVLFTSQASWALMHNGERAIPEGISALLPHGSSTCTCSLEVHQDVADPKYKGHD